MAISLRPTQIRRYTDLARLLVKYSRSDVSGYVRAGMSGQASHPPAASDLSSDAEELCVDLEQRGPTFVKLGQLLSTRADLLPAPYLAALATLQDRCEPVPYLDVVAVIEAEFEAAIGEVFADFDPEPLASASLGQVHRARLADGRSVAVKVQRPDIAGRIARDLDAIAEIAALADRHTETGKAFGFGPMVEEFRRSMLGELDYRREAANLELLARNLAGFERIVVPQPVRERSTERVLTMDLVAGRRLSESPRIDADGAALAGALISAYLKQIVGDGFFHADPHPGNVWITDDGRLALLDLGMVARLSPKARDLLLRLLVAISDDDGASAATAAIGLGEPRDDRPFDEATFVTRVSALVSEQQGAALDTISPGAVVSEISRIAGETGLRPIPELTMLGKALLNLDEVARTLDPSFRPADAIRNDAAGVLRRRMMPTPARVLTAALEAKEFAEHLPRRVNQVMDALAEGQMTLNVQGINEAEFLHGLHRIANRVTTGLVLAALIIGAAMMMNMDTPTRLFGYPALGIVCFLLAGGGGFALLASILWGDRRRS
jgi:predicted unusual protein kinase regulating ubiquinone biosynthesis (AarF/ABC1/UbiB family)